MRSAANVMDHLKVNVLDALTRVHYYTKALALKIVLQKPTKIALDVWHATRIACPVWGTLPILAHPVSQVSIFSKNSTHATGLVHQTLFN